MTTHRYTIYKAFVTLLFLAIVFVAFEFQHIRDIQPISGTDTQTAIIALRLIFLLTSLSIIALLIAKKPFLAYVALGAGFLLGFTRTETVLVPLLGLLLAGILLHRLALYIIEKAEAAQ